MSSISKPVVIDEERVLEPGLAAVRLLSSSAIHQMARRVAIGVQICLNVAVSYVFSRIMAHRFGTTAEKDGFDIAISVPMILLSVGGLGFLSSAITVHAARLRQSSMNRINEVFSTLLTYMLSGCIVFGAVCCLLPELVVGLLAPGLDGPSAETTRRLLPFLVPLAVTLGLGTYYASLLMAFGVPVTSEFCLIFTRIGVIAYAIYLGERSTLIDIAVGLTCLSLVASILEGVWLRTTTGIRLRCRFYCDDPEFRAIVNQSLSLLAVSAVVQFSWAYVRRMASLDGPGTNASLTYLFSIINPLSVLLSKPFSLTDGLKVPYATTAADCNTAIARLMYLLLLTGLISSAIAGCAQLYADELVAILFGGGKFDATSVASTAAMFRWFVWGLPGSTIVGVATVPLLAMGRGHAPAIVLTIGYAIQTILTAVLFPSYGAQGIAIAYVISTALQAFLAIGMMFYRLRQ